MHKKHLTKELSDKSIFSVSPRVPQFPKSFPLCTPVPPVHPRSPRGFSLLELLIVIAILVTMATIGSGMYRSFGKNVELSSVAQEIAADLRHMQSKAMAGEGGFKWGGHFVNTTPDDYYILFSTSGASYADGSTVSIATTTLSKTIAFSDPTDSTSKDIIFNKISGTTTVATIGVISEGLTQTVNISSVGTIY